MVNDDVEGKLRTVQLPGNLRSPVAEPTCPQLRQQNVGTDWRLWFDIVVVRASGFLLVDTGSTVGFGPERTGLDCALLKANKY